MKRVIQTILLYFCLAVPAFGQTALGELTGFVQSGENTYISGVSITVSGTGIIGFRKTITDAKGFFRVAYLPPGIYSVEARKKGYKSKTYSNVHVRAGRIVTLIPMLEPGEFTESIVINEAIPLIDSSSVRNSTNISSTFIENLAMSPGKEWTMISRLIPTAVSENDFLTSGTIEGFRMTILGSDYTQNVFTVDGFRMQTFAERPPISLTTSVVEDIEILENGFDARAHSGTGAMINIVTKSGGSQFDRTASLIFQPRAWSWLNDIRGESAPRTMLFMPEFSVGGPLIKNKTWFFASILYDLRRQDVYRSKETINRIYDVNLNLASRDDKRDSVRFFAKTTTRFSDGQRFIASFILDELEDTKDDLNESVGVFHQSLSGGIFASMTWEAEFNDLTKMLLSVGYRDANMSNVTEQEVLTRRIRFNDAVFLPEIDDWFYDEESGVSYHGRGSDSLRVMKHFEFKIDIDSLVDTSWGDHILQYGIYYRPFVDFEHYTLFAWPSEIHEIKNNQGNWIPHLFVYQRAQNTPSSYSKSEFAFYVQDRWFLNENIVVNAGLRAGKDDEQLKLIDKWYVNYYMGVAFAFGQDNNSSLRFSYSKRHQMIGQNELLPIVSAYDYSGAALERDIDLDGTIDSRTEIPSSEPYYNTPGSIWDLGINYQVDPDLKHGYIDMFQAGFSTGLMNNIVFDVAFNYSIFHDRIKTYPLYNYEWLNNEPVGLKDENISDISYLANNKWSKDYYWSWEFRLSRHFSNSWQLLCSYIFQTKEERGEWSPYEVERYYIDKEWFNDTSAGELPKHIFRLAASYQGWWNTNFSMTLVHQSSRPESPPYNNPFNMDFPQYFFLDGEPIVHPLQYLTAYTQPRSQERETFMEAATMLNVAITKSFNISDAVWQVQLQVYNLLNTGDIVSGDIGGYLKDSNQRRISNVKVQAPRSSQITFRVSF